MVMQTYWKRATQTHTLLLLLKCSTGENEKNWPFSRTVLIHTFDCLRLKRLLWVWLLQLGDYCRSMVSFCVYNAFVYHYSTSPPLSSLPLSRRFRSCCRRSSDDDFSSFAFIAYQRGFLNFAVELSRDIIRARHPAAAAAAPLIQHQWRISLAGEEITVESQ